MVKLAIVGSRDYTDYESFKAIVDSIISLNNLNVYKIISGRARGTDTMAEQYAKENSIPMQVFKANWEIFGKKAGMMRNRDIVANSDYVLAFWDGESKGTKGTIDMARKDGKLLKVMMVEER